MNILVVGSGGREHALIKALKKNREIETIYALPGNGGMAKDAVCVPIGAKDIENILSSQWHNLKDFLMYLYDQLYHPLQSKDHVHLKTLKMKTLQGLFFDNQLYQIHLHFHLK